MAYFPGDTVLASSATGLISRSLASRLDSRNALGDRRPAAPSQSVRARGYTAVTLVYGWIMVSHFPNDMDRRTLSTPGVEGMAKVDGEMTVLSCISSYQTGQVPENW